MMQLLLPDVLKARIVAEACAAFPRECCGLIEGRWRDADLAEAVALHPAPNLAADPDRFEIDPEAHFAALKRARAAGHALIGCYHSHPGGAAVPSARDLAGAGEEDFLWLIAALHRGGAEPELAGYRYCAGRFGKIGLVTGADLVTSSLKLRN
jgi:proteasome lid subunit RPN8/RPN11